MDTESSCLCSEMKDGVRCPNCGKKWLEFLEGRIVVTCSGCDKLLLITSRSPEVLTVTKKTAIASN